MSQIFIETVARAIGDYRFMLRRHLDQVERRKKLAELNLKDPTLFESALKLYEVAWKIVEDIENNIDTPSSYYAYSGVSEFGKFLKEYLSKYEIEEGRLVHSAQKASKIMIQAIQILSLPAEQLTPKITEKLNQCSEVVVKYGSDEQKNMYEGTLEQRLIVHRDFFAPIYDYFQKLLENDENDRGGIVNLSSLKYNVLDTAEAVN